MSYDLIGALPPGVTPAWMRAVVTREGDDVVTRCCVVAEGQVLPIEVRVNVPALAATLRSMGLGGSGNDSVSGFGSFLKKAVKAVTKNKIVKAVGKAVSKVAKSPIVQIANPMAAIAVHTSARAAGARGTIKGAAGKIVNLGTRAATSAAGPAIAAQALAPAALSFVSPQTTAALGLGLKTVQTARLGSTIASVAKNAQSRVNLGKAAAAALKAGKVDPKKAIPFVQNARKLQQNVIKLGPQLSKQVVASSKVKKAVANIAAKARAGSADAKQAAAVIAKSAQALDKILQLQARAAGGLPGLLVTADGRVVKAPRGRFQLRSTTSVRPDILYRGAKEPTLKGLFAAVSGVSEWGGYDDPANQLEGPLYPARYPEGGWQLEDLRAPMTGVSGVLTP